MIKIPLRCKYGLVLSGGGMRGIAHLGVIKALKERNIHPGTIAGTSAGAIVAAFIADGYAPEELLEIVKSVKRSQLIKPNIPRKGFFNPIGIKKLLETHLKAKNIEDLKTPIYIAATNLKEGRPEYFSKGNLVDALMASSCMPVLFNLYTIKGTPYIDGGVMDNLPIAPIRNKCRKFIAVHVNPLERKDHISSVMQIGEQAFHLAIASDMHNKKALVDVFIEPHGLMKFGLLDPSKADDIFKLGYQEAIKQIDLNKI